MKNILLYLALVILSFGCMENITKQDSQVLARVNNKYLYLKDIEDIIPEDISPRDSISLVRSYVNDWVKTNVIISQAETNLPDSSLDFSKQLDEYRNSLIIYKYETSLIDQKLDTVVSEEEINSYYNEHLTDFELKENITKSVYIVIDNSVETEDRFDQIFNLPDSTLFDSLEIYAPVSAISYNLDTTRWISFFDIQKTIPIETYNIDNFLKNNSFVKISGERYIYYVLFYDFKIKDEISPLDFKRKDIYNIIISKRKIRLAKKVRNDIYERAKSNNDFEVYYNQ